jgi:hypothetical protein
MLYGDLLLGTSVECAVRLTDPCAEPKHALVTRQGGRWWIRDLGTTHGLRQDGVPRREFELTPGVEIGIGASVLVAESARGVAVRAFCHRLLGWGGDRMRAVDHALRAVRLAMARRSPLVLCGDGDLIPIARTLHRFAMGDHAPFVVCDRRRRNTLASVRSAANHSCGVEAFASAIGGSVCVRRARLPADFDELTRLLFEPGSEVRLFVCMEGDSRDAALVGPMAIHLPPLQIREAEIPRIIDEYVADAIATLRAPQARFSDDDRRWVMRYSSRTIPEIEKGTLRVVALKISQGPHHAAMRLGMAPVSLARWLGRRGLLTSSSRRAPRPQLAEPTAPPSRTETLTGCT